MSSSKVSLLVKPGAGVGEFEIGMSINACIRTIEDYESRPGLDILYDAQSPLATDIILRIEEFGMQLRFEPMSQRLRMIDVYNLHRVGLEYAGVVFAGQEPVGLNKHLSSLLNVYKLFGPTFPGTFDRSLQSYLLQYRGLCLRFPIPEEFHELYSVENDLPLEFPGGASPHATQLLVYGGSDIQNPSLPRPVLPHFDLVNIQVGGPGSQQVSRGAVSVSFDRMQRCFYIGDSVQDILSELGAPTKQFVKQNDKMRIHSSSSAEALDNPATMDGGSSDAHQALRENDYFFNYFELGLDLLIDGRTNVVKKVVAHTNFPGHPEFNIYNKCNFQVQMPGKPNKKGKSQTVVVGADMEWTKVEAQLGDSGRPMVRDNGTVANPFGATLMYAYNHCVFEVLRNGHIASITVF